MIKIVHKPTTKGCATALITVILFCSSSTLSGDPAASLTPDIFGFTNAEQANVLMEGRHAAHSSLTASKQRSPVGMGTRPVECSSCIWPHEANLARYVAAINVDLKRSLSSWNQGSP